VGIGAGGSDTVAMCSMRIIGVVGSPVAAGLNGVRFLAGAALRIENCTISGFSQIGIDVNVNTASGVSVFVTDSVLSHNATGIAGSDAGRGGAETSSLGARGSGGDATTKATTRERGGSRTASPAVCGATGRASH